MNARQEVIEVKASANQPAVKAEAGSDIAFVQMIERVAQMPDVRMDVLQGLVAMRNDELRRVAEQKFNEAMALAQADMGRVAADKNNSQTKSRYASYAALDRVLRPVYTKHGFSLSFDTGEAPGPEIVRVLCYVSHGGFTRTYKADMPADGKGAKGGDVMTKTHAAGSAFSYGARYLLKMIFNVAVGEDDDDGNAAGAGETITEDQASALQAMLMEHDIPLAKFFKVMKIEKLSDLPVRDLPEANRQVQEVIAARARKREGAAA